ncbi:hypothetical protein GGF32_004378 [Allomyces javanicus]|nr:hypothetical protein GGF32_004378 [Allomyces javanicus]
MADPDVPPLPVGPTPPVLARLATGPMPASLVSLASFPAPNSAGGATPGGPNSSAMGSDASLYQQAFALLERLAVIDFFPAYIEHAAAAVVAAVTPPGVPLNTTVPVLPVPVPPLAASVVMAVTAAGASVASDPVTLLWTLLRLGEPLAWLINLGFPPMPGTDDRALDLASFTAATGQSAAQAAASGTPVVPHPEALAAALPQINNMKTHVFHALVALRQHGGDLRIDPERDLFSITQLYSDDTSGLLKVLQMLRVVLDAFERQGRIPRAPPAAAVDAATAMTLRRGSAATFRRPSLAPSMFANGENGVMASSDSLPSADAQTPTSATSSVQPPAALTLRERVLVELLTTERKYVQDLERLRNYHQFLASRDIVSPVTLSHMFSNLNALVDFQRRFLIGLETLLGSAPPGEERVGALFVAHEMEMAKAYQEFCANYQTAIDTALDNLPALQTAAHVMEPQYEVQSFLIKPIQRICRYPLLLNELIKKTKPHPELAHLLGDLQDGLLSMKRAADAVNEARRRQENRRMRDVLRHQVEDWKGQDIETFGDLLLYDRFVMRIQDFDRDFAIFLFDKIMLCCKELAPAPKPSSTLLKRKSRRAMSSASLMTLGSGASNSSSNVNDAAGHHDGGNHHHHPGDDTRYQIKGRIWMGGITDLRGGEVEPSTWMLTVVWSAPTKTESFTLRCRNEEQYHQWRSTLERLVEDTRVRSRSRSARPRAVSRLRSEVGASSPAPPTSEEAAAQMQYYYQQQQLQAQMQAQQLAAQQQYQQQQQQQYQQQLQQQQQQQLQQQPQQPYQAAYPARSTSGLGHYAASVSDQGYAHQYDPTAYYADENLDTSPLSTQTPTTPVRGRAPGPAGAGYDPVPPGYRPPPPYDEFVEQSGRPVGHYDVHDPQYERASSPYSPSPYEGNGLHRSYSAQDMQGEMNSPYARHQLAHAASFQSAPGGSNAPPPPRSRSASRSRVPSTPATPVRSSARSPHALSMTSAAGAPPRRMPSVPRMPTDWMQPPTVPPPNASLPPLPPLPVAAGPPPSSPLPAPPRTPPPAGARGSPAPMPPSAPAPGGPLPAVPSPRRSSLSLVTAAPPRHASVYATAPSSPMPPPGSVDSGSSDVHRSASVPPPPLPPLPPAPLPPPPPRVRRAIVLDDDPGMFSDDRADSELTTPSELMMGYYDYTLLPPSVPALRTGGALSPSAPRTTSLPAHAATSDMGGAASEVASDLSVGAHRGTPAQSTLSVSAPPPMPASDVADKSDDDNEPAAASDDGANEETRDENDGEAKVTVQPPEGDDAATVSVETEDHAMDSELLPGTSPATAAPSTAPGTARSSVVVFENGTDEAATEIDPSEAPHSPAFAAADSEDDDAVTVPDDVDEDDALVPQLLVQASSTVHEDMETEPDHDEHEVHDDDDATTSRYPPSEPDVAHVDPADEAEALLKSMRPPSHVSASTAPAHGTGPVHRSHPYASSNYASSNYAPSVASAASNSSAAAAHRHRSMSTTGAADRAAAAAMQSTTSPSPPNSRPPSGSSPLMALGSRLTAALSRSASPSAGSGRRYPSPSTPLPPVPQGANANASGGPLIEVVKCRVYHNGNMYVLLLPRGVSYQGLVAQIKRKVGRTADVRIKYEDEDSDFVLIAGDEDVATAMAAAWTTASRVAAAAQSLVSAPAVLNLFVFDV